MNELLRIRRQFGKSQAQMASIAGVDQATWSRWERGLREPNIRQIGRVRAEVRRRGLRWNDAEFFRACIGEARR